MQECAHCYAQLGDDDVFCNMCGKPLETTSPAPPPTTAAPLAPQPTTAAPPAPPPETAAPLAPEPSATAPRRGRTGLVIGMIIAAIALLGCCAAGGVWLLLRSDGLDLQLGTSGASAPDGYSVAFEEAYEDPTFGPQDASYATAWVLEPVEGGPEADDVVYAVVFWFGGAPGTLDDLFDEWRYPRGVEGQIGSMVTSDQEWETADFAADGDVEPGGDLAVRVDVLLREDSMRTSHERDSVARRLTEWAMENPPD